MGAGRQPKIFTAPPQDLAIYSASMRNLSKNRLGGVVFGCTKTTIEECLSKQLFVESCCPVADEWKQCPSLREKMGSLAAANTNNKFFAMGAGNRVDCFADVEMLDLDVGRWIRTQSMLQKRMALVAVELNGVLYATGGYDGNGYLNSVDRFDPRERSWTKIASMHSKRSCHSSVVLNEKMIVHGCSTVLLPGCPNHLRHCLVSRLSWISDAE